MRQTIRHISVWPVIRLAFLCGALLALLPGLGLGLVARAGVLAAEQTLSGMRSVTVAVPDLELPLVGVVPLPDVQLNLVRQLGLDPLAERVNGWNASGSGLALLITLAIVVLGGVWSALTAAVVVTGYNLSARSVGGIEVTVAEAKGAGR